MRSFSRLACVVSDDVMCGRDMYEENETDPFLTDLSLFRGVQVACDGVSMLGAPPPRPHPAFWRVSSPVRCQPTSEMEIMLDLKSDLEDKKVVIK